MIHAPAIVPDLHHVLPRMRPADRREVYAGRWTDDPADVVADLVALAPLRLFLETFFARDGEPVALIGAHAISPGVADIMMVATDRWAEVSFRATRWAHREGKGRLTEAGIRRAQCRAHADHDVSIGWLQHLGMVAEGTATALGRDGEDFVLFAWLNPAFRPAEPVLPFRRFRTVAAAAPHLGA